MVFISELRMVNVWLKCLWLISLTCVFLASPSKDALEKTRDKRRTGYIINERGQLIPFKIYKKEMCQLSPRNCRAYNKRLIDLPRPYQIPDQQVHKRGIGWPSQRKNTIPSHLFNLGNDDIFDPGYDVEIDDDKTRDIRDGRQETLGRIKEELESSQISQYPITDPRNSINDFTTFDNTPDQSQFSMSLQRADDIRLLNQMQTEIDEAKRMIQMVSPYESERSDKQSDGDDLYDFVNDIVRQSLDNTDSPNIVIPNTDLDVLDYHYR